MSMPKTGRIDLDTKPVTGESDQGAAARCDRFILLARAAEGDLLPNITLCLSPGPPAATGAGQAESFLLRSGATHMLIKPHSSNRSEWPLGTGRSAMHASHQTGLRRRYTHGHQGTAQGNRASVAQGGVRNTFGFLPFQTSPLHSNALTSMQSARALGTSGVGVDLAAATCTLVIGALMSLTHFALGCAIVAVALVAYALLTSISACVGLIIRHQAI